MRIIKPLAVFLFTSWWALSAQASDYYIDITNDTGYTILFVYISPDESDDWEEDVLGDDVLEYESTIRVDLSDYNDPIFDIKLVDEDGDSYTYWDVDVSLYDLTVTLDGLDEQ